MVRAQFAEIRDIFSKQGQPEQRRGTRKAQEKQKGMFSRYIFSSNECSAKEIEIPSIFMADTLPAVLMGMAADASKRSGIFSVQLLINR